MKSTIVKYTTGIEVPQPADVVFNHLLNNVPKFWPEDFEGQSSKLDDEFIFTSGESHYSKNRVIGLVPNQKVVWLVIDGIRKTDNFEWTGTKMTFDISAEGDQTEIAFTYEGPVADGEHDRLVEICDLVIKENLYNLIASVNLKMEIPASPQHVFNCVRKVSKWWSKDFEGKSSDVNDEFVLFHPEQHYSKQRIIEVTPIKRVVWLVTESTLYWLTIDKNEWTNTRMIFEVEPNGNDTLLHITHYGLVPTKECYELCKKGWNHVIRERLLNYITTGQEI